MVVEVARNCSVCHRYAFWATTNRARVGIRSIQARGLVLPRDTAAAAAVSAQDCGYGSLEARSSALCKARAAASPLSVWAILAFSAAACPRALVGARPTVVLGGILLYGCSEAGVARLAGLGAQVAGRHGHVRQREGESYGRELHAACVIKMQVLTRQLVKFLLPPSFLVPRFLFRAVD